MCYIIDLDDAEEYSVELRQESFYLHGFTNVDLESPELTYDDLDLFIKAINIVRRSERYRDWYAQNKEVYRDVKKRRVLSPLKIASKKR